MAAYLATHEPGLSKVLEQCRKRACKEEAPHPVQRIGELLLEKASGVHRADSTQSLSETSLPEVGGPSPLPAAAAASSAVLLTALIVAALSKGRFCTTVVGLPLAMAISLTQPPPDRL